MSTSPSTDATSPAPATAAQPAAPAAAPAQPAAPAGEDWQAKYAALEASFTKKLAAEEKKRNDAEKRANDPAHLKDALSKLLQLPTEKDPAAAFAEAQTKLTARERTARSALLRAEVTDALREAEAAKPAAQLMRLLDLDDVEVDLDAGKVSADVVRERVAALKTGFPELFKQAPAAPAAPERAAPVAGVRLPTAPQPAPAAPISLGGLTPRQAWELPLSAVRQARGSKTNNGFGFG